MEHSHTLPYASLPLAAFNLYPFLLITCNHEYNSFQWALGVLVATMIMRIILGNLQIWSDVRSKGGLGDCALELYSLVNSSRDKISDITITSGNFFYLPETFNHDFLLSGPQYIILICLITVVVLKSKQYCPSQDIWQCLETSGGLN